ncbi:MAG: FG-GAP-like repeat-containing protein [Bryobacterales bacterium]|nr:FG-GAP-like repeat-containing protein [Bryobacterales bacterium]
MRRPDRRGFLTWLAGAAAFRPARALGQDDLAATFRQARPCQDLRELADAAADTFELERLGMEVERALADMLDDARLPLDAGFEGPSPMPSRYSVRDGLLFGEYASGEGFRAGLERWVSSLGTVRRAMFHALPDDVVRFEVSSEVESRMEHRVGIWRMVWRDGRLVRFEPLEETVARSGAPLFADVTAELFGSCESFRDQLSKGLPYWRSRIDVASGIGVYGNQGVSVGDIDGDGWDEVYVCQPAGLPNRLYSRQGDGTWADITADAGVDVLDDTSQALFLDLRNIGVQDLVVLAAAGPLLFLNDGSGRFRLRERAFRFETPPKGTFAGMAAADFDRDGLVDLYLCSYLYFRSEDQYRYPAPYHDATNGPPNFLLRNELGRDGQGRFTDVTEAAGFGENNDRYSFAAAWCDYDEDGWPELYVANDFGRNNLFKREGGKYRDVAARAGVEDIGPGMSAAWFDYDGDGRMDLYVTNMWTAAGQRVSRDPGFGPIRSGAPAEAFHGHTKGNSLYRNQGDGAFEYVADTEGVEMGRWSWSGDACDFDLDGTPEILITAGMITHSPDKDLCSFFWRRVVSESFADARPMEGYEQGWNCLNQLVREDYSWNGNEPNVFYARRDGAYRDLSGVSGLDVAADSRAFAVTDLDGDGRPDLLLKSRLGPQLIAFRNESAGARLPLVLELEGTESNRDAIGTIVKVKSAAGIAAHCVSAGSGYISQHTKRLHVGIGDHASATEVSVLWPSGRRQRFERLEAGYRYRIREGEPEARRSRIGTRQVRGELAEAVVAVNSLGLEPTWLLDPLPLPEPVSAGLLVLAGGPSIRLPSGVPAQVLDLSSARHETASAYAVFRRYIFDYRADLELPMSMLVDDRSRVRKVYPGLPSGGIIRMDYEAMLGGAEVSPLPFPGRYHRPVARNQYQMGAAFLQAGQPRLALPYLREAADRNASNAKAWLAIGQVELGQGRLAEADSALRRALAIDSELPQAWNNLGGVAMGRQDYRAAASHFERALDINGNLPYALINAAQAHSQLGNASRAEVLLRRALDENPGEADAANKLGLALAKQGKLQEARVLFQQAIEHRRDHTEAINNLAVLYLQLRQVGDAIAALRYGISRVPDFATFYMNLARVHADRGDYASSRSVLEELLVRQPRHEAARRVLVQLQGR